jgi:hypothetical protein
MKRTLASLLLMVLTVWFAVPPAATTGEATIPGAPRAVFDADPDHLWNRLHHCLYSRTSQDGSVYAPESLEPFFLPTSKFLVEGRSHELALKLLDKFLKTRADEAIADPVKRAVLQRDLWAVFTTLVGDARQGIEVEDRGRVISTDRLEDAAEAAPEKTPRRRDIEKRLVQIMRRIALAPEQIDALPDNLSEAVKAGAYPGAFDAAHPDRAFLPPDLLARSGPWVAVSNSRRADNGSVAAVHHVAFTKGRSVFVVFLRLPEGRRATEAYLEKLQKGELQQFPQGTQTALLRPTLLIDSRGKLRLSPLTESLQVRTFARLDTGTPCEFTLRRADLFAGRSGGLHAVGADETSYFDFQTRGGDVFEMAKRPPAEKVLDTCTRCHTRLGGHGGIHTVQTLYGIGCATKPAGLVPSGYCQEAAATIRWTSKTYTWGLLQGLWEAEQPH